MLIVINKVLSDHEGRVNAMDLVSVNRKFPPFLVTKNRGILPSFTVHPEIVSPVETFMPSTYAFNSSNQVSKLC